MLTWWMIILLFVYVVICILLMIAILLQSGKGGGLSSLASGGASGIADAIGATGAERTMNKITTIIAVSFMVMAILLVGDRRLPFAERTVRDFRSRAAGRFRHDAP
jgi:protein translocase SecG subunit